MRTQPGDPQCSGVQGTSRGGADIDKIVRRIALWSVNMLFVVGGNGGNAAANAIHLCCEKKGVLCSVVGVPKSIDNDILLVSCSLLAVCFAAQTELSVHSSGQHALTERCSPDRPSAAPALHACLSQVSAAELLLICSSVQIDRCFGFDTAVEEAQRALLAAKVEARSAYNGLGLVRLMGRSSGYIAMQASMASGTWALDDLQLVKFVLQVGTTGRLGSSDHSVWATMPQCQFACTHVRRAEAEVHMHACLTERCNQVQLTHVMQIGLTGSLKFAACLGNLPWCHSRHLKCPGGSARQACWRCVMTLSNFLSHMASWHARISCACCHGLRCPSAHVNLQAKQMLPCCRASSFDGAEVSAQVLMLTS